jgi:hypothetical protein
MRAKHACSLARPRAGNQLQLGRCYTTGSAILAMNLRHWILRLCTCILTRAHSGCDASPQDPNCRVGKFRRRGCYVSPQNAFPNGVSEKRTPLGAIFFVRHSPEAARPSVRIMPKTEAAAQTTCPHSESRGSFRKRSRHGR